MKAPFALHDWIGDQWAIIFSHPKDFTPVCTTEFGAVAQLAEAFASRNTRVLGLSVDGVNEHKAWKADIEAYAGAPATFRSSPTKISRYPRPWICCPQTPICPMAAPPPIPPACASYSSSARIKSSSSP